MQNCTDGNQVTVVYGQEFFRCFALKPRKTLRNNIAKLSVLLYLHDFADTFVARYLPHYISNIHGSRGAKVLIHEANTFPDVNQGFDIGPGMDIILKVKEEMIKRLKPPYGECTKKKFLDNVDNLPNDRPTTNYKYGINTAIARCQQLHTIERCGCFDPYRPITDEILYGHILVYPFDRRIQSCYALSRPIANLTEVERSINCFESLSYDKACSHFVSPCDETKYEFQLFETPWPHESYELAFYSDIINVEGDNTTIKFGDKFDVYDDITRTFHDNATEGYRQLQQEDLIERNFIQLTVQLQVSI